MKNKKKPKELPRTQDALEAYPEKEQVDAFPERRYIKMTRFLTILTVINLAAVIALSGYYFYKAKNVDIRMTQKNKILLYSIDPERKLLLPSERNKTVVSAKRLVVENALRQYLDQRYSSILDMAEMKKRWDREKSYVARLSSEDVANKFKIEADASWNEIWKNRISRDTHIYELYPTHSDLWEAYIETFDFPLEENLLPICNCYDNSHECLACKEKNSIKRQRKKIWLRVGFDGEKICDPSVCDNPFGIMIYAYYFANIPVPQKGERRETFWDLPPALRPKI